MPVDIMPGANDPANYSLPQQVIITSCQMVLLARFAQSGVFLSLLCLLTVSVKDGDQAIRAEVLKFLSLGFRVYELRV